MKSEFNIEAHTRLSVLSLHAFSPTLTRWTFALAVARACTSPVLALDEPRETKEMPGGAFTELVLPARTVDLVPNRKMGGSHF